RLTSMATPGRDEQNGPGKALVGSAQAGAGNLGETSYEFPTTTTRAGAAAATATVPGGGGDTWATAGRLRPDAAQLRPQAAARARGGQLAVGAGPGAGL